MTEQPKMRDGIIQRGSTYSYVVRERDPQTGKTRPRWVGGFRTRADAKRARDAARHAVQQGVYVPPQDVTLAAWLDRWLEGHAVELKPSTVHSYRAKIDLYVRPVLGRERLQSLSPSRLSVYFRALGESGGQAGKPLSARSVEYVRAILRKALQDAVVERLLTVNPVVGSKAPRRDGKPQHTTWTAQQVAAFIAASSDHRYGPLWTLALATGLRRGELIGLRWPDLDLEAGLVAVERSTTQLGKELVTTTPKNHERRKVQIDAHTVASLRSWRKVQAAERLAWGPAYTDTAGQVFTREDGTVLLPDYISKAFVKTQAGLELPRIVLHEARHSHATMLLRAGVPVHIVAKRLGHKDPSVTLNVYADVIPDDDGRAVEMFSRAVWGA